MTINTIYNFKAAVNDYARPNRYAVSLPIKIVDWTQLKDPRRVALNCNAVSWPARNIGTIDDRIAGPLVKMPYDRIYSPVTMSFYADAELREWEVFNVWMDNITQKQFRDTDTDNITRSKYMEYYNLFVTDVEIAQVDMIGKKTRIMTLKDAYPIAISEIGMAYDSSDQVSTFNITLTYKYFETTEGIFNISSLVEGVPSALFGFVRSALGFTSPAAYSDLITEKSLMKDGQSNDILGTSSVNKDGNLRSIFF